jgi:hypothetical protein
LGLLTLTVTASSRSKTGAIFCDAMHRYAPLTRGMSGISSSPGAALWPDAKASTTAARIHCLTTMATLFLWPMNKPSRSGIGTDAWPEVG